jgi:acetyltransferase-like isoleucine patch superfamily enzyme
VRIAHYTSILDHDYEIHQGGSLFDKPRVAPAVTIDSNVWIGAYCVVMKGVTIGCNSVIAAQTILRSADILVQSLVFNKGKSDLAIRNLGSR